MKVTDGSTARSGRRLTATAIEVIDQTLLPHRFGTMRIEDLDGAVAAIKSMVVRGAPLIGATAAFGLAMALRRGGRRRAAGGLWRLLASRPTAVNLRYALDDSGRRRAARAGEARRGGVGARGAMRRGCRAQPAHRRGRPGPDRGRPSPARPRGQHPDPSTRYSPTSCSSGRSPLGWSLGVAFFGTFVFRTAVPRGHLSVCSPPASASGASPSRGVGLRDRQLRLVDRYRPRGHADLGDLVAAAQMAEHHQPLHRGHDAFRGDVRGNVSAPSPGSALVVLLAVSLSQRGEHWPQFRSPLVWDVFAVSPISRSRFYSGTWD